MEWKKVRLGEIAEIVNGATPSTSVSDNYNGNIVWITPKDLSDMGTKYIERGSRNITQKGFDSCSTHMIPAYNILMSSRAPIGLLAINKVACCTNQGFKNLVLNKEICDVDFVYYSLNFHIKEIESLGAGTTFKEVSKKTMEMYKLGLPPLPIQQRIASVLSALDRKIALNRAINHNLEAMAKQLYDYWFVQFDFPDANGRPYKSSGGEMVWNERLKREIPKGWEVKGIYEIEQQIITGKTPSTNNEENFNGDIPFITIDDIRKSYVVYETERTLSRLGAESQKKKYLPRYSLCCSCIGTTGIIGYVGQLAQTNQQINSIIFEHPFNREYLFYSLKLHFKHARAKVGNILLNMSKDEFSGIACVYPQIEILQRYHQVAKKILDAIDENVRETNTLTTQRDTLLPLLMNGQVSVNSD